MKKLFYLIILGAGIIGCSTDTETLDDLNNIQEVNFTFEDSQFVIETYDFYNNGGKLKGSLQVTQDCDNLYVQITGDPDDVFLGVFNENENPDVNLNNGKVKHSTLPDDLGTADNYQWTFPLSDFTSETLKIFARSWGNWAGDLEYYDANYLTYTLETCVIEEDCESGYMEGDTDFSEIDNNKKWGWANYFKFDEDGEITMDILKNDASGNHEPIKLGEVTINYNQGAISITPGENVEITHLYVSETRPESSAPGQFDQTQDMYSESGNFWVIIKAEVCQ